MFLRLLFMVVVPLVFATLSPGVAGDPRVVEAEERIEGFPAVRAVDESPGLEYEPPSL